MDVSGSIWVLSHQTQAFGSCFVPFSGSQDSLRNHHVVGPLEGLILSLFTTTFLGNAAENLVCTRSVEAALYILVTRRDVPLFGMSLDILT
jgi:hypothetical protein